MMLHYFKVKAALSSLACKSKMVQPGPLNDLVGEGEDACGFAVEDLEREHLGP